VKTLRLSIAFVVTGIILLGCGPGGETYDRRKAARGTRSPAAPDQTEVLLAATRKDLRTKTSELKLARNTIRDLTRELNDARRRSQQGAQALQRTEQQSQAAQSRLQTAQAELRRSYESLQRSKQEQLNARKTLEEWDTFYQAYEAEIQEYTAYIQAQENVIQRLETLLEAQEQQQEPPSRIPERLVAAESQPLSRRRFFSIVQGMTVTELRNYLGAPDAVTGTSPQYYVYNRPLTYVSNERQRDLSVRISIKDGTVKQCFYTE